MNITYRRSSRSKLILFLTTLALFVIPANVFAALANTPWPMYRQNLYHTGVSTISVSGSAGIFRWKYATGGLVNSSPAIGADGTVYIGCVDSSTYAIKA
jgi:hypothetical protein